MPFPAKENNGDCSRLSYTASGPSASSTPADRSRSNPSPRRNSSRNTAGGSTDLASPSPSISPDNHGTAYLLIRKYQFGCPAHSTSHGSESRKGNSTFRAIISSAIALL